MASRVNTISLEYGLKWMIIYKKKKDAISDVAGERIIYK